MLPWLPISPVDIFPVDGNTSNATSSNIATQQRASNDFCSVNLLQKEYRPI